MIVRAILIFLAPRYLRRESRVLELSAVYWRLVEKILVSRKEYFFGSPEPTERTIFINRQSLSLSNLHNNHPIYHCSDTC